MKSNISRPILFLSCCLLASAAAPAAGGTSTNAIVRFDLSRERAMVRLDDARSLRDFYDRIFVVTSLQGLANRNGPRLAVRYDAKLDDFWWKRLTETGAWLSKSEVSEVTGLPDLLKQFRGVCHGAVVYDESVPATSHVAAAVAGADDLLVLRYDPAPDSIYHRLTTGPDALAIKVRLINEDGSPLFTGKGTIPGTDLPSTGSTKNDAYRWLIERYLKPGKLNPEVLAYLVDAFWLKCWRGYPHQSVGDPEHRNPLGDPDQHTLCNLDFIIANRGIPFDLHVYADELPVDDPSQKLGTDFETYKLLLKTCNDLTGAKKIIMQYGFTPWAFKYTEFQSEHWKAGGKRNAVHVEWQNVQVASAYNCAIDADAMSNMPNGSLTQHFPNAPHIPQVRPRPNRERMIAQGILEPDGRIPDVNFYAHYGGDYDGSSWLYKYMPFIWAESEHKLPVSWAINPNLSRRMGHALQWIRSTATSNDDFISGDNGAGYLFPYQLSEPREFSGLPGGVALWEEHNTRHMRQWDLEVVGFVIDGLIPMMKPEALDAYARFAPGGIGTSQTTPAKLHGQLPILQMAINLPMTAFGDTVPQAAQDVKKLLDSTRERFIPLRSILWKPRDFVALEKELDRIGTPKRKLVDMSTLLWLARHRLQGAEIHRSKSD